MPSSRDDAPSALRSCRRRHGGGARRVASSRRRARTNGRTRLRRVRRGPSMSKRPPVRRVRDERELDDAKEIGPDGEAALCVEPRESESSLKRERSASSRWNSSSAAVSAAAASSASTSNSISVPIARKLWRSKGSATAAITGIEARGAENLRRPRRFRGRNASLVPERPHRPRREPMSRLHSTLVAFVLGAAAATGLFAVVRTARLGQKVAVPQTALIARELAARHAKLARWSRSLQQARAKHPPALPKIPKFAPVHTPSAPAAPSAATSQVTYVRPRAVVKIPARCPVAHVHRLVQAVLVGRRSVG